MKKCLQDVVKVKGKICLAALLAVFAALGACLAEEHGARFKHEYEILNNQVTLDGENVYQELLIPEEFPIVYVDGEEANRLLEEESGILYLGFPECPWCRTLLPALIAACGESGYAGNIYYYNALRDRDVMFLSDDGEIVVDAEGAQVYHDLVAKLYGYLEPYGGLDDPAIRRIYFPTTVFFSGGAVASVHLDTVDSQENGYDPLTGEQFEELKGMLIEQIGAIQQ